MPPQSDYNLESMEEEIQAEFLSLHKALEGVDYDELQHYRE